MSDLSKLREAQSWVSSWKGHYKKRPGGTANLAYRLRKAADEQATNLRFSRRHRDRVEYVKAVAYLESAALEAEEVAARLELKEVPSIA